MTSEELITALNDLARNAGQVLDDLEEPELRALLEASGRLHRTIYPRIYPEPAQEAPAAAEAGPRPKEYPVPSNEQARACRSCGAPIVWTVTEAGKSIPLSLTKVRVVDGQRLAPTHFADCPHADQWRRG